jgi:hypothetical protein
MDISELYNWRDAHGRNMGTSMGFLYGRPRRPHQDARQATKPRSPS